MAKIAYDVAEKEVNAWLDSKKVGESKRVAKRENIETLINAMCDGDLILKLSEPTKELSFIQTLKTPLKGEKGAVGISELKYKNRMSTAQLQACMKSVKLNDGLGIIIAIIGVLTGELNPSLQELDTEDFSIAQAIASFFLPS